MNIIEVKNYQQLSEKAADYIIRKITLHSNIKLGLSTGGTPVGTYRNLVEDHKKNGTSYQRITTFNLDEYIGLSGENKNSYRYYMDNHLFNHIDIKKTKTFIPHGNSKDYHQECLRYENLIAKHGGIDLQILGIGSNGHIGFNEPGTSFESKTHVVNLAPSTIKANSRFFSSIKDVPTKAITMGISTIMQSKEILLLVSGENKKEAMYELLNHDVDENFPASVLKSHPHVIIMVDKAAVAGLKIPAN